MSGSALGEGQLGSDWPGRHPKARQHTSENRRACQRFGTFNQFASDFEEERNIRSSPWATHRMLAFVSICGSLLLSAALAGAADQSKTWHIGLCHVGLDHEPPSLPTLHQALNEMG